MTSEKAKATGFVIVIVAIIIAVLLVNGFLSQIAQDRPIADAPLFSVHDIAGKNVSLENYRGRVVILHFAYITTDVCAHCKYVNEQQINELKKVRANYSESRVEIITIDMTYDATNGQANWAKNTYNISWPVINDVFPGSNENRNFEQAYIGRNYSIYMLNKDGALSNPTIILINKELKIVGKYNIGQPTDFNPDIQALTKSENDSLLTLAKLSEKIDRLERNEWGSTMEGKVYAGATLGSMFLLGIFVSITPCALALMLTLTSYVAGVGRKKKAAASAGDVTRKGAEPAKKDNDAAWFGASVGLAFTLGIGVVFFTIGCVFTFLGFSIANAVFFYVVAGAVLIIFGIHNIFGMGLIYEKVTKRMVADKSADLRESKKPEVKKARLFDRGRAFAMRLVDRYVLFGAFFLGMLLAVGWAPCALAFMFPALILVMTQQIPVLIGGLYLFVFSLGYGIPVVALAAVTATLKARAAEKALRVGKWIPRIFGIVIIAIGLLMILRFFGFYLW